MSLSVAHIHVYSSPSSIIPVSKYQNTFGKTTLARSGRPAGHALEGAVKVRRSKHGGAYPLAYRLIILAFSACDDHPTSVRDKRRTRGSQGRNRRVASAGRSDGKLASQARETGKSHGRWSIATQRPSTFRKLWPVEGLHLEDGWTGNLEDSLRKGRPSNTSAKRAGRTWMTWMMTASTRRLQRLVASWNIVGGTPHPYKLLSQLRPT